MIKLIALASLAMAAPAHAVEQFDLDCSGIRQSAHEKPEVYSRHYIIDLKAGFWCFRYSNDLSGNKCYNISAFKEVTPSKLTLQETPPSEKQKVNHFVNRETGVYFYGEVDYWETGTCEPRPFSGLPNTAKF